MKTLFKQPPVRRFPLHVYLFVGPSGTGKTQHAKTLSKSLGLEPCFFPVQVFSTLSTLQCWVDPSVDRQFVVLDDFTPRCLALQDLLQLLDPHSAVELPVKGHPPLWWDPHYVVITTSHSPDSWFPYKNAGERQALMRRIHATYLFSKASPSKQVSLE